MTIWKYTLALTGEQSLAMPAGAKVLCVQLQYAILTMWALVDPTALPAEYRLFHIYGTGHQTPTNPGTYVGTVQEANGQLVWHVFVDADRAQVEP